MALQLTPPAYKEDLCATMLFQINMNRFDVNLIGNISNRYLKRDGITQKQRDVIDKCIYKYRRQLKEGGVIAEELLQIPWQQEIRVLEVQNKDTYFLLENNILKMYFPFNKDLINEMRTIYFDDNGIFLNKDRPYAVMGGNDRYMWKWNPDDIEWYGEFNVHLFKELYKFAIKHNITIHKSITDLLKKQDTETYKWTPHIHISNHGQMYINCITESMMPVLHTFDMFNTSAYNIEELVTTLAIRAPYSYNNNLAQLISSSYYNNKIYDTSTTQAKEELRDYLKDNNSKVLLLLTVFPGRSSNEKNNMTSERKFTEYFNDIDITIPSKNTKINDKEFDTVITDQYGGYLNNLTSNDKMFSARAVENFSTKKVIRID